MKMRMFAKPSQEQAKDPVIDTAPVFLEDLALEAESASNEKSTEKKFWKLTIREKKDKNAPWRARAASNPLDADLTKLHRFIHRVNRSPKLEAAVTYEYLALLLYVHEVKRLFVGNPMKMEITRFRRRFIHVTQSPRINQLLVGIVGLSYLVIAGFAFEVRKDLDMEPVAYIQMALMLLAGIVASHGAIAGEKDRRSWDLLQVAPVTQYQIVVGKFMGSTSLLLAIQAAFLPLLLMFSVSQPNIGQNLVHLGIAEVLSLGVGLFASAGTIFLSSKIKTANSTLVAAIALASLYGVVPLLFALFWQGQDFETSLSFFHPFYWLWKLLHENIYDTRHGYPELAGLLLFINVIANYVLAAGALSVTGSGLTKRRSRE